MTGDVPAAARAPSGAIIISERALELMVVEVAEDAAEKAVRKVLKEIGLSTSDEARIEEARADIEHQPDEAKEDAAEKAVRKVLKEIGLSTSDEARIEEARADIEHLRRFRRMWDRAALIIGTAVLTVLVGGALTVLWLGIKTHVLKQP